MAKNYRENFDYAEAIANTQDSGERQQLLAERQNKIDAEGLTGKVASNEAVATWNGSYRPYSVSSQSSGGSSGSAVSQLYEAAEKARLQRLEAARARIQQQLQNNLASIETDYTTGMTQTDINARQSVISNEEKLAALGLNMGARGAAATSGAAETSRIAIDNQYRSDLNALGQARLDGARCRAGQRLRTGGRFGERVISPLRKTPRCNRRSPRWHSSMPTGITACRSRD